MAKPLPRSRLKITCTIFVVVVVVVVASFALLGRRSYSLRWRAHTFFSAYSRSICFHSSFSMFFFFLLPCSSLANISNTDSHHLLMCLLLPMKWYSEYEYEHSVVAVNRVNLEPQRPLCANHWSIAFEQRTSQHTEHSVVYRETDTRCKCGICSW